jgi:kynureninase
MINHLEFNTDADLALEFDKQDILQPYRNKFHIPTDQGGKPFIYLCGNSLGLEPIQTKSYIHQELDDWQKHGVEGHLQAKNPWLPYHEFLTEAMSEIVGAKHNEVVVMNTLSVNLHLMMVSFYRPTKERYKILIEHDAFPSDRYAVASQLRYHGYDVQHGLIELFAREGEYCIKQEDIENTLDKYGDEIALILIGNTNYYTGQYFDMKKITELSHSKGCVVAFDCAHAAGNIDLQLHDSGVDFAVWCTYKYLNSGPGSLGAAFIHERHYKNGDLPRFEGWWGHNKQTRFKMRDDFDPIYGIEAWQLSNPPILSMAAIKSSLDIFKEAGIKNLRAKSIHLTSYLEYLLKSINTKRIEIITPSNPHERGAQLSVRVIGAEKSIYDKLYINGVIADWREPDVIRVAPVPLYNSYEDVYKFYTILTQILEA